MNNYDPQQANQALEGAAPEQVDAHRSMLAEILQTLEHQGVNTAQVTAQAGASTTNPSQMSPTELLNTTLALARQHPEIVRMVAQKFPQAQGILNMVLGTDGSQSGAGDLLGGLLGRL